MRILNSLLVVMVSLGTTVFAHAEETTLEKAETAVNKSVDGVKKTYRNVKDKACETINGKLDCAGKKIKSGAQNAADKISTTAKDVKNKVD